MVCDNFRARNIWSVVVCGVQADPLKLIRANGAALRADELMAAHYTETTHVFTAVQRMPKMARAFCVSHS